MSTPVTLKTNPGVGADVLLKDLGFLVPSGGGSVLIDREPEIVRLPSSSDLRSKVVDDAFGAGASTIVVSDGVNDIPQAFATSFLESAAKSGTARSLDNLIATVDPLVTDDLTKGYSVGSLWANITTDTYFLCTDAAAGAAVWRQVSNTAGSQNTERLHPGRVFLGDLLHYHNTAVEISDEIQFVRNWLEAGQHLTKMEIYPTQLGGSARFNYMGIYDQVTPTDPLGVPNDKVAEITPYASDTVVVDTFFQSAITTPGGGYTVPTSGYYWFAYLSSGTGGPATKVKPVITVNYVPGFTPIRFKAGQTSLPASAGAVTIEGGALIFIAGVE